MTSEEDEMDRTEFLASLGLPAEGEALAAVPTEAPAKPKKAKKNKTVTEEVTVDKRTMPVSDIVFTPDMIEGFDVNDTAQFRAASTHLFSQYQSVTRNKDRNSLLHRRITEFLQQQKRAKRTGGFVTERVQVSQEVGDLAQLLQQHNITAADLAALIQNKG